MTSDLVRAVERLRIGANEHTSDQDESIGGVLSWQKPEKRTKGDTQALKKELEKHFLTPQTSFGAGWLDEIQQYVTQPKAVRLC